MVSADTIKRALAAYEAEGDDCAAMIITAVADDPTGYGRVLRDSDGSVDRIIEHRDCTEEELKIKRDQLIDVCLQDTSSDLGARKNRRK